MTSFLLKLIDNKFMLLVLKLLALSTVALMLYRYHIEQEKKLAEIKSQVPAATATDQAIIEKLDYIRLAVEQLAESNRASAKTTTRVKRRTPRSKPPDIYTSIERTPSPYPKKGKNE